MEALESVHVFGVALSALCVECHEVGSRVTCDPPVTNTDHDWLCLVRNWREFVNAASRDGFYVGGSVPSDAMEKRGSGEWFISMRRDRDAMNLIVTESPEFVKRFMAATSVARRLNLLSKDDRIAVFQAVLYGNIWLQ